MSGKNFDSVKKISSLNLLKWMTIKDCPPSTYLLVSKPFSIKLQTQTVGDCLDKLLCQVMSNINAEQLEIKIMRDDDKKKKGCRRIFY